MAAATSTPGAAVAHACKLRTEGADVIELGLPPVTRTPGGRRRHPVMVTECARTCGNGDIDAAVCHMSMLKLVAGNALAMQSCQFPRK